LTLVVVRAGLRGADAGDEVFAGLDAELGEDVPALAACRQPLPLCHALWPVTFAI
jgi:hypothetical protein